MAKALARSIKTKRDYQGATAVAGKLRARSARETDEERRLQALLREIEKVDGEDMSDDDIDPADGMEDFPRRRWSDDE